MSIHCTVYTNSCTKRSALVSKAITYAIHNIHGDQFLACLDKVQEELLYYRRRWHWCRRWHRRRRWHWRRWRCWQNVKVFTLKFFYVMGKALSGELSCPCDRSCFLLRAYLILDGLQQPGKQTGSQRALSLHIFILDVFTEKPYRKLLKCNLVYIPITT